jgi:hypothetical protein
MQRARRVRIAAGGCVGLLLLALVMGPAASHLQSRADLASPRAAWDAVYLVAGAHVQDRRVASLTNWLAAAAGHAPSNGLRVLIGNDPQPGHWCRRHQTNHTRAAWAVEKLSGSLAAAGIPRADIVPGRFGATDGEMEALNAYLAENPRIARVALVSSAFHARRLLACARRHDRSAAIRFGVVAGPPCWENRAPWIVLGEYAKMLRDALGLARAPGLTRAAPAPPRLPVGPQ